MEWKLRLCAWKLWVICLRVCGPGALPVWLSLTPPRLVVRPSDLRPILRFDLSCRHLFTAGCYVGRYPLAIGVKRGQGAMKYTTLGEHVKKILNRWTGIGLMAASMLTIGGMLTLQSDTNLASSVPPQQVLMADGGGDRPAPPPCPSKKCWSEEATI